MTSRPWMPLNIEDYIADTNHLSAAEHGAYLLLIMRYWRDGGLPSDERLIQRFSLLSAEQWKESRDILAAFFEEGWKHRRIDAELAKADEVMKERQDAGRNGARKRWAKPSHSSAIAEPSQTDGKQIHTNIDNNITSPSLHSGEVERARTERPEVILGAILDPLTAKNLARHLGRKLTPPMAEMLLGTLREVASLGGNPAEAANLMIRKGWSSLEVDYLRNAGFAFGDGGGGKASLADYDDPTGKLRTWPIEKWRLVMERFRQDGNWNRMTYGPPPGEPGSFVPAELQAH